MTLLTDALRSGPGSPEWHQAVKTLRSSDQNVDEFTLLHSAREHLESGKQWRSVRAGQGFTRKVFDGIESQAKPPTGLPTANVIALIAAGVILAIVAVVGVLLLRGGGGAQQQAIDQLTNTIFGNRLLTANFDGPALPDGWEKFGELSVITRNKELHPTTLPAATDPKQYKSGGLVTNAAIAADQPMEIDVKLHLNKPGEEGIVEVFVSDGPVVGDAGEGTHELTWVLQGSQAKLVLPSTPIEAQSDKLANQKDLQVRIQLNRDTANVETNGKRLYAGPNQLAPNRPRYVGVRFRSRAGDKGEHWGVSGISLQKP